MSDNTATDVNFTNASTIRATSCVTEPRDGQTQHVDIVVNKQRR